MNKSRHSSRYHASLYLGVSALALLSSQAIAQDMTQPEGMPEQVIVTGSLLGDANFAAPTPVVATTAAQIQLTAETGIGTTVGELPFVPAGGGLVNNTNGILAAGQDFATLGPGGTLILVNGIRPTPSNQTNTFDLDMIPSVMVERFETVTTGASASYGSDAVAGVINFILKDRMEGFTANAQYGISQYGDENQTLFTTSYGTTLFDGKGHFEIGAEFANQYNTVDMYARPWGQQEPGLDPLGTNRPAGTPANIFTNHAELDSSTEGGLILGCTNTSNAKVAGCGIANTTFTNGGTPTPYIYGTDIGSSYQVGTGEYGESGLIRQLSPPYTRWAGLARFEYDITPDTIGYVMVNYGELESNDPSDGSPFPIDLTVYSGNPYIPASIQQYMSANKIASIQLAKMNLNGIYGPNSGNTADNVSTLIQTMFGLKGTVFDKFNWDLDGLLGHNRVTQVYADVPATANLDAAADVVLVNGVPSCNYGNVTYTNTSGNSTTGNRLPFTNSGFPITATNLTSIATPGCVPYDPFGVPSAASVNYIDNIDSGPDGIKNNMRQFMVQANLNGPVADLPAGPLDLAVGASYRYNSFEELGSPADNLLLYTTKNSATFFQSQSVDEAYAEVGIPIVRDLPFAQAIDLNAAGRFTDYSISGGVYTWKYGATWDVFDWLRLRATRSQDIRAPNFSELSPIGTSGQNTIVNPVDNVSAHLTTVFSTGSPYLQPEVSQNATIGFVIQPTMDEGLGDFWDSIVGGFRASADYKELRVAGLIGGPNVQVVVNGCLQSYNAVYCNDITFASGFYANGSGNNFTTASGVLGITSINVPEINLSSEYEAQWDFDISQKFSLEGVGIPGKFQISALAAYTENQITYTQTPSVNPTTGNITYTIVPTNGVDGGGTPRWAINTNLLYNLDRLTANLQLRYYSPIKYSNTLVGPGEPTYAALLASGSSSTINQNVFPAAMTYNLHLAYDVEKDDDGRDLQVYLNVDNLLNTPPPVIWSYVSNYDVVGRYFKIGVRYTMP